MSELRFDGRVAIVTGAAANPGLGRSYAHLLAERGAKVVVNDLGVGPEGRDVVPGRDPERVVEEIVERGGEAVADHHSVADADSAAAVVQTAIDTWGRVDILINNAGVGHAGLFLEIAASDYERTVGAHLMGTIWMCRAVWPHLRDQQYGRILNIGSPSVNGQRHLAVYAATKGGSMALTSSLAIEGSDHGITVNSLAPGAGTASALSVSQGSAEWERAFMARTPEQVAPAAAFLVHEVCPVSGRHFVASGGSMREIYFAQTAGIKEALTLEDVRDDFDVVLDRSAGTPIPSPLERGQSGGFTPRPYLPPE
jgi:NAD(P)-dependent dehydrogenase (short-subunit alcohol dehydrogenase family)